MLSLTDAFRASRLEAPVGKICHAVLDTDISCEEDDQFALAYAVQAHKMGQLVLEAVYTEPFTSPDVPDAREAAALSVQEAHHVLSLLGKDDGSIPVFRGADCYSHRKKMNWDEQVKGLPCHFLEEDGSEAARVEMTPVDSPAVRDLIERAHAHRGGEPLYVLGIGAATNIASALALCPDIAESIVILWLGGTAPEWPHVCEYNLRQDLPASRFVLDSAAPLFLLPSYNVVTQLTTTVWELEHFLDGKSEIGTYLTGLVRRKSGAHPAHIPAEVPYAGSKVLWDVAAVAALVHPEYLRARFMPSPYVTDDLHWAWDCSRHQIKVLYNIFRNDVFSDLFYKLNFPG